MLYKIQCYIPRLGKQHYVVNFLKVVEKVMIRNQYSQTPPPAQTPNGKGTQTIKMA